MASAYLIIYFAPWENTSCNIVRWISDHIKVVSFLINVTRNLFNTFSVVISTSCLELFIK